MLDTRIALPMLTLALAACDGRTEDPPSYKLQVTESPPAVVGERSHLVLDVLRADGTKATQFEAHHGQVTATSAGPGQGATFTVRLPLR